LDPGLVGLGHQGLLVDLDVPGQVGGSVPLGPLGLLVELVQLGPEALGVVPGELGRALVGHQVPATGLLPADD
jgi:hypothetical protein